MVKRIISWPQFLKRAKKHEETEKVAAPVKQSKPKKKGGEDVKL